MSPSIDVTLNRLILEGKDRSGRLKLLREWAMQRLRMEDELDAFVDLYVRIRLALSLCPVSALNHSRKERLSRFEKIENYLVEEGIARRTDAHDLATAVEEIIDDWLTTRVEVASYRDALVNRDGPECQSCRADLSTDPFFMESVTRRDGYKLTWLQPERSFEFAVDHRIPVSKLGTNELENLQILCRFCNEGKDDGGPLLLQHEIVLADALPVEHEETARTIVGKSAKLFYRVLQRDSFACSRCGHDKCELTIRKVAKRGLAVLSNLTTLCYQCVDVSDS